MDARHRYESFINVMGPLKIAHHCQGKNTQILWTPDMIQRLFKDHPSRHNVGEGGSGDMKGSKGEDGRHQGLDRIVLCRLSEGIISPYGWQGFGEEVAMVPLQLSNGVMGQEDRIAALDNVIMERCDNIHWASDSLDRLWVYTQE